MQRTFALKGISNRSKYVIASAIGISVLGWFSWGALDGYLDKSIPYSPSQDVKAIVEGNNVFALELYQQLAPVPGNLFFSPFSISTSMGVVFAGARGTTERELSNVLHFTLPQTNLHPAFGSLTSRLRSLQRWNHLTLLPANSLWTQKNYPIKNTFVDLVRSNYEGEVHQVDFKQSSSDAAAQMATWIDAKSRGRLNSPIQSKNLDQGTRLAICDVIYFKGEWAKQFHRSNTKDRPFSITTNETVTVPMMYQKSSFKMSQIPVEATNGDEMPSYLKLLELPYYGRDISMVIILPDRLDGLPRLESQLNPTNLSEWLKKFDSQGAQTTHVSIPRFHFTKNIDLRVKLKGMGINTAFGKDANLSGMEATTNLFISEILHEAFVDVNEHGTEAAALTMTMAKSKSMDNSFRADHPFIFLIRENSTGCILFLGRVVDPKKS